MADTSSNNISVTNLTAPTDNAGSGGADVGAAKPTVSKTDPSLLHQISSLQQENQTLLATRRELEGRLKDIEDKMKETQQQHEKEKALFIETQRTEMQEKFEAFMKEWVERMQKQNPEVISKVQTGIDQLIKNGKSKDHVWELLCCASQAHKQNVNTIEELTKTNDMLSQKNKELEDIVRAEKGFSDEGARLGKRMRINDTQGGPDDVGAAGLPPGGVPVQPATQDSDVWGQFESFMSQNAARTVY